MLTAIAVDVENRLATVRASMATKRQAARDERGAAMAEYGLLLALIALAAIGILAAFGGEIREVFTDAEDRLNTRGDIPPPDE